MNFSRTKIRIASIGLLIIVTAGCATRGPLTVSLSLSQARSGDNRSVASSVDETQESLYSQVEYKNQNELKVDRISGFAWSVLQQPQPKESLRQLADAFGVVGEIQKVEKNSFTLGFDSATGTGMRLWVGVAGAWWSFTSSDSASSVSSCVPDAASCVDTPISFPQKLLTSREALNRTATIMTRGGYNSAAFRMSATTSQSSTDVTGTLEVAGVPTNLVVNFSFGEDGKLVSGSGPLLNIKRANGYYLVDPNEAVNRLNDVRYTSWGPVARGAVNIAVSSVSSATDAVASAASSLVIPITGVRYTLMQATLTNGASILLPAYTYFNIEGDVGTVIAMKDENLIFNAPSIAINTIVVTEPVAPGDGTSNGTSPGLDPSMNVLTDETAKSLIGLSETEASKIAAERGWVIRIAMRDGEAFMLTLDYSDSRVNLTLVKKIVTAVTIG